MNSCLSVHQSIDLEPTFLGIHLLAFFSKICTAIEVQKPKRVIGFAKEDLQKNLLCPKIGQNGQELGLKQTFFELS